jgi:hypothetical protein
MARLGGQAMNPLFFIKKMIKKYHLFKLFVTLSFLSPFACTAKLQKNFCDGFPIEYPPSLEGTYVFVAFDNLSSFGNYKEPSSSLFRISSEKGLNQQNQLRIDVPIGLSPPTIHPSQIGEMIWSQTSKICKIEKDYFLSLSESDAFAVYKMEVNASGIVVTPQSFRVKELESSGLLWTSYEADVFNQISENVSGEDKSYNASNSNEIIVLNSRPEHNILLAKLARPMATTLRIYRADSNYISKVESQSKSPVRWRRLISLKNASN